MATVITCSNEYKEQLQQKKRDEHSVVHPVVVTNEPELFLHPDIILESFLEAEQIEWKRRLNSPFPMTSSMTSLDSSDGSYCGSDDVIQVVGEAFLRHSKSLPDVYDYFMNLDPRRNCVKMVEDHTSIPQPLKIPTPGAPMQRAKSISAARQASGKKQQWTKTLDAEEKEIYMLLLRCTYHPPLDEPIPSPSTYSRMSRHSRASTSSIDAVSIDHNRLIQKPMRAFHISEAYHNKLKNEMFNKLPNQDITIALSDELNDQLARLESDDYDHYQRSDFSCDEFYEAWRMERMDVVACLLRRWCDGGGLTALIMARKVGVHDAFNIIVRKLLTLDLREKTESMMNARNPPVHPSIAYILTTESKKLVHEYCLWYGIDGIYRQISILNAMVEQLTFGEVQLDWYLECLVSGLNETLSFVNERIRYLVNAETNMAASMFNVLIEKLEQGFLKLFYLYKKRFITPKGIEALVLLLDGVQQGIQLFRLNPDDCRAIRSISDQLSSTAKENYRIVTQDAVYKFQSVADTSGASPEMLKHVLQEIKKFIREVEVLTGKCQLLREKCRNIPEVMAVVVYKEFMKDVKELCFLNTHTPTFYEVKKDMMGLAYRLDRLDRDWSRFVPPARQKWRVYFKIVLDITIRAIAEYLRGKTTDFVLNDDFKILYLEEFTSKQPKVEPPRPKAPSPFSISIKSDASAFTSVTPQRSIPQRSPPQVSTPNTLSAVRNIQNSLRRGSGIDVQHLLNANNFIAEGLQNKGADSNEEADDNDNDSITGDRSSDDLGDHVNKDGDHDDIPNHAEEGDEASDDHDDSSEYDEAISDEQSDNESFHSDSSDEDKVLRRLVADIPIIINHDGDNGNPSEAYNNKFNDNNKNNDNTTTTNNNNNTNTTTGRRNTATDFRRPAQRLVQQTTDDIINDQCNKLQTTLDKKQKPSNSMPSPYPQRRCNSEPYTRNPRCPNIKSSTAAINYVKNGPTIDGCLNENTDVNNNNNNSNNNNNNNNNNDNEGDGYDELIKDFDPPLVNNERTNNDNNNNPFPQNGQILTTSSFSDVLVSCSRLISFAENICSIVLPTSEKQFAKEEHTNDNYEIRVDVFYKLLVSLKDTMESYATNIVSLDNCGSRLLLRRYQKTDDTCNEPAASPQQCRERVAVPDIIQGNVETLPGCRHIRESVKLRGENSSFGGKPCPLLRKLLVDSFGRWELVTRQMCFRINNIYSCIKVLPSLQRKAAKGLNIDLPQLLTEINISEMEAPAHEEQNCGDKCPCRSPPPHLCFDLKLCHRYLGNIVHMQVKLLSCRVMDIFNKLFAELRSLPQRQRSICQHMKSCLKYLSSQIKFLRHVLYKPCLDMVLLQLCALLVEKFHDLMDALHRNTDEPYTEVMNLKDILMCTVRCLEVEEGEVKEQINQQLQLILYRFQLYFLPLTNIRALFDSMAKHSNDTFEAYTIHELLFLLKRTIDAETGGKSTFTGTQFQNVLLKNNLWLDEFSSLLGVEVSGDRRKFVASIGSYLLVEQHMRCCSVFKVQSDDLVRYTTVSCGSPIKIRTEGAGNSTQIDLSEYDEEDQSLGSSGSSWHSRTFYSIPEPNVGSEIFFARDNVNYCFRNNGDNFAQFLLILLKGELFNMIRETGQWVRSVARDDVITIFRYEYAVNRDAEAKAFFAKYREISPVQSRRISCAF